jgi:FMN phosphatase YigB (HAD superfamily)
MIHYVFDLDDTLIVHQRNVKINYDTIQEDSGLKALLDNCKGECYIYTNGTFGHAHTVLKKMNIINNFFKVYSRDTLPYMKPDPLSFVSVQNDIQNNYQNTKVIYFFDDLLENLKVAKNRGWITFWIHPDSNHSNNYVDYRFPDIKTCLKYLEEYNINNTIF